MVTEADAPASRRRGAGRLVGCLPLLVGVPLGFAVELLLAEPIIQHAWMYCMDMPWPPAADIADSPRFSLIGSGLLFLALYPSSFPVGFWMAWFVPSRHHLVRVVAACVAGLLLLGGVFTTDLVLYVSPPRGEYVHARCPAGRPPWWPTWLPLQTSPSPVDFKDQG